MLANDFKWSTPLGFCTAAAICFDIQKNPVDVLSDILFIYSAVCFDILFYLGFSLKVCVVDLVSGPVGPGGPRALLSSP